MMDLIIETFGLEMTDRNDGTRSIKISPNSGHALQKERRKLYIIADGKDILYIGEANTSIKIRFQRGSVAYNYFIRNSFGRGGYKGYKWLNPKNNHNRHLMALVATFDQDKDQDREFVEAVEGELVYLIRLKTGKWPNFQNEIHFSNRVDALETANIILEKIIEGKFIDN